MFKPDVIPVPTWALEDKALAKLAALIHEVMQEADTPDDGRGPACIEAIRAELVKRGSTISLSDLGGLDA